MGRLAEALEVTGTAVDITIEFPLGAVGRCALIHGFLSVRECEALVRAAEQLGFNDAGADYPPSYRDNDRMVADDPALAARLFERLGCSASRTPELATFMAEDGWRLDGVNERVRFCRYRPGTQFRAHQDGVHHRQHAQSRLTFMVYLNDEEFTGGDTVFFDSRAAAMANRDAVLRLHPRKGSLVVFDHGLWHAGALVESGNKYVLRSDLMYQPDRTSRLEGPFEPGHRGYVWALAALCGSRLASAGRDGTIRLWDHGGSALGHFDGHTQSILGLVEAMPGELVSHSRDRTIRRWCLATGESSLIGTAEAAVLSAERLECGRIATGDAAGRVTIWDSATREAESLDAHASWAWAIARLGNGGFATASEDGTVKLWRSKERVADHLIDLGHPLRTLASWIGPDGRTVAAAGDAKGTVYILALDDAPGCRASFAAHDGAVRRVRFESGHVLLTCGEDGRIMRWNLQSQDNTLLGVHENFATDVICIGAGRWISCGYDGRIFSHGAATCAVNQGHDAPRAAGA